MSFVIVKIKSAVSSAIPCQHAQKVGSFLPPSLSLETSEWEEYELRPCGPGFSELMPSGHGFSQYYFQRIQTYAFVARVSWTYAFVARVQVKIVFSMPFFISKKYFMFITDTISFPFTQGEENCCLHSHATKSTTYKDLNAVPCAAYQ